MASTGDDTTDTDSLPDDVFRRSSSAPAGAEEEVQYAQDPRNDSGEASERYQQYLEDDNAEQQPGSEDDAEEDYSDEDDDRENRFDGPASTWRFYTESERALANSLDQQRANDLSIHLYNAHALKATVRDPEAASQAKHHHGKKHWIKIDEDGVQRWHPHADWTAWPLRPEDVPRRGESFGAPVPSQEDEKATYRKPEPWKPSVDLEEEVQAIMLRTAKERLAERARLRPARKSSLPYRNAQESSPRKRKRPSSATPSIGSSSHDDRTPRTSHSPRHDGPGPNDAESFEVLIDDDEAAEVLQPSARHVISKLDDLLLGLHRSRRGHLRDSASPRSRSRSQRRKSRAKANARATTEDGGADSPPEEATDTNGRKLKQRPRPVTTDEAQNPAEADRTDAEDSVTPQGNKKQKRKAKLNPRDWSEVLGMASLVGWDSKVVQRANARCSSLFGESMAFHEPGNEVEGNGEDKVADGQGFVVGDEAEEDGYSCPVASCPRHGEPWPLKKTWRWREHMKRSHKYSKGAIEKLETELKEQRNGDASNDAHSEDNGADQAAVDGSGPQD